MSYGEKGSGYNNSPIPIFEAGNTFVVNSTGQFIYNGTPAAGNLVESNIIPQVPTSDGNGNLALPGVTSYFLISGSTYVAISLFKGELIFSTSTTGEGGPWVTESTLIQNLANQLTLNCPQQLSLSSGLGASLGITNLISTVGNLVLGNGNFAYATNPAIGGQETWHTMSGFQNSFSAGGETPRYMLKPDNTVRLAGSVQAGATNAAGVAFFTLPVGWRPASNALMSGAATGSLSAGSGTVQALSSGALATGYATVSGNAIWLDGMTFPLD